MRGSDSQHVLLLPPFLHWGFNLNQNGTIPVHEQHYIQAHDLAWEKYQEAKAEQDPSSLPSLGAIELPERHFLGGNP